MIATLSCYTLLHFESTNYRANIFHDNYLSRLATSALNESSDYFYNLPLRADKVGKAMDSIRTRLAVIREDPNKSNDPDAESVWLWKDLLMLSRLNYEYRAGDSPSV